KDSDPGRSWGPVIEPDAVSFRLWAPAAQSVELKLEGFHAMERGEDGWFTLRIPGCRPGAHYKFRIDGELEVPDPASHFQPKDVLGPSEVIDHDSFSWRAADWRGRP